MRTNLILFGWNRSTVGREHLSVEHFGDFVQYLTGLENNGAIDSFEPVFLSAHGGDLNGFFLIRADNDRLNALMVSEEWMEHIARAGMHLDGHGVIRGVTGELIMEGMDRFSRSIP